MNAAVLIPAYQPGEALPSLARALGAQGYAAIVIVDDGSGPEYSAVFEEAAGVPGVQVLRHERNRGKGAALKTGIAFVQRRFPGLAGVVTADADGQHHPDDVERVARVLERQPSWLVLGARAFKGGVPLRSRIGNALARWVVHFVVGQKLSDTQTGLRAIPAMLWPALVEIEADGYEFELEMLMAAHRAGVPVAEEPIRTIYQPGNPTSHFNPLVDSMKIYFVLLRFASVSVMTAVIDNVVFYAAYRRTGHILESQILGRAVAVAFNYLMVRRSVFYSRQRHLAVLPQYLMLVLASGAASYGGIRLLSDRFGVYPVAAKLAVETGLFFVNFAVQRVIFRKRAAGEESARRVLWISWAVFLVLAAVAGGEAYGFATHHLFAGNIWFPLGLRRLVRYACLFTEAGLPMLLMAPWIFAPAAAALMLAGTLLAAPAGTAAAAFLLLSCWTLGAKLIRGAGAACSILLGAGVYICAMTLAARLPIHYPLVWAAVLALPIAAAPRLAVDGLRSGWNSIRGATPKSAGERAALALLVFVAGMHWLVTLKPEIGADALAMHLAIPVDIAAHHRLTYEPDRILWSVMPMGADWTYSIAYLLGGEAAARLFNFAMLAATLALIYELSRRWVSRATALLLAASFAATPLVQLVTGSLFVENLLAALLLGFVAALWRFADTGEKRFFAAAAVLAGTALGVKLAAVATLAMALPFVFREARRRRVGAGAALLAAGLFLAAALPTYAIAYWKTGDPLFPFLNQRFPTPLLDRSVILRDFRYHEPLSLRTPFELTFATSHFYEGQDGSFGFQYLLLIPLAVIAAVALRRREPWLAAVAALGAMTSVMVSQPNTRYLYPSLPLLTVAAAALLGWMGEHQRWLGRVVVAALVAATGLNLYFLPASGWYQKEFYSQLVWARNGRDRFLTADAPARDVAVRFARQHPDEPVYQSPDNDLADFSAPVYAANWHQYHVWEKVQAAADRRAVLRLFDQWKVRYVIGQDLPPGERVEPAAMRDVVEHCLVREYQNHWAWWARVDRACGQRAQP